MVILSKMKVYTKQSFLLVLELRSRGVVHDVELTEILDFTFDHAVLDR